MQHICQCCTISYDKNILCFSTSWLEELLPNSLFKHVKETYIKIETVVVRRVWHMSYSSKSGKVILVTPGRDKALSPNLV